MICKEKKSIKWLEFDLFQPFNRLIHGSLVNHKSKVDFCALSLKNSDSKNFNKIQHTLALHNPVYAKQLHGKTIEVIDSSNQFDLFECDGFITNETNIPLFIRHADCQVGLFYDPNRGVIANVHCGWRGLVQNIYRSCVDKMVGLFGCRVQDIYVGISPSLGPNNSEFKNYKLEFPESFWRHQYKSNHFNLWSIARSQLIEAGLLAQHIEIAEICTYENVENFYSYRRNKCTERNATFICLKD